MNYIDITVFLIKNKILKWIILIGIVLTFFIVVQEIKRFAFPKVELFEMSIITTAPNYSIEQVEKNITNPIEEKLDTISGIKEYSSSSFNSFSFVKVEIDRESDIEEVKTEIRNKIDEITDFPDVVTERPRINEFSVDNIPIFEVGISTPDNDLAKMKREALRLKKRIKQLDVVAKVEELNIPEKKVWVLLNKEKMHKNRITFVEVINALKNHNISVTAGELKNQKNKFNVVTLNEYKTIQDIENVLVRVTKNYDSDDGIALTIKDLGVVKKSFAELDSLLRFNGQPAVGLNVIKKKKSDTITAAKIIQKVIDDYKQEVEDQVNVIIHFNDAEETTNRINIAFTNGLVGLVLVFIILIIFLNYKIAFWTVVGIPIVFILNIILMKIFDLSINNISLSGIIITLGIIVDNAIIVGESIFRFRQKGFSNQNSVVESLKSVIKPLTFALLTTILSFVSIFFIPGVIGDFAIEIPLVVIFMLSASFIESTLILPTHLYNVNFKEEKNLGNKILDRFSIYYQKALSFCLKNPVKSLLSIISIFIGLGVIAIQFTNFFLFPIDQAFNITISGETKNKNENKESTLLEVKKIERIINSLPEKGIISSYKTIVGGDQENKYMTMVGGDQENKFSININLISYFDRETTAEEVKNFFLEKIADSSDIKIEKLDYYIDDNGPPQGKPIEINVFGFDDQQRLRVINEVMAELQGLDFINQLKSDYDYGKKAFDLEIKENTYYASLNPELLANSIRFALAGIKVEEIQQENETVDIELKFDQKNIDNFDFLKDIFILNDLHQLVEVESFLKITDSISKGEIKHKNGEEVNVISANFNSEKISANKINALLKEKILTINQKYPNISITLSGEAVESAKTFYQFLIAIIASIIGIYLLLVIQFNHFLQPLMVITSIPFGIIGIVLAFAIQGFNLSLLAMIGILGFGGVVINASLIMVDFINRLKKGEYSELGVKKEYFLNKKNDINFIIIYGANLRLRPIIITTLTTLLGIMPTAYGLLGKTDSTISPMTLAMFWGLLFGTGAGLFVTPIIYLLNENLSKKIFNREK